jgi:hypothetical protein
MSRAQSSLKASPGVSSTHTSATSCGSSSSSDGNATSDGASRSSGGTDVPLQLTKSLVATSGAEESALSPGTAVGASVVTIGTPSISSSSSCSPPPAAAPATLSVHSSVSEVPHAIITYSAGAEGDDDDSVL